MIPVIFQLAHVAPTSTIIAVNANGMTYRVLSVDSKTKTFIGKPSCGEDAPQVTLPISEVTSWIVVPFSNK